MVPLGPPGDRVGAGPWYFMGNWYGPEDLFETPPKDKATQEMEQHWAYFM